METMIDLSSAAVLMAIAGFLAHMAFC